MTVSGPAKSYTGFRTETSIESLNKHPDLSMLDDDILPIIDRLLDKDPAERYQSAEETLHALCEATNTPIPKETKAIRESFLQTSHLIGRRAELRELRDVLDA